MLRSLLMILLLLAMGCTHINYRSQGNYKLYVGQKKDHQREFTVTGREDFYLWGFVPSEKTVWLDKEMRRSGMDEASKIRIEEYQTLGNWLTSIFTFGIYTPISYRIKGFGKRRWDSAQ